VTSSFERGIKGEKFLDRLSDYQLKRDFASHSSSDSAVNVEGAVFILCCGFAFQGIV
jgi:hypothetical protein